MNRLWAFLLLLLISHTGFGAGLIVVGDEDFWQAPHDRRIAPRPHRPPSYVPLEMTSTRAEVTIKDQLATTRVDQEFYNSNSRRLEGTFLFPVPKGARIDKFTMDIDGKPVEAELLDADKARAIYEDIVRRQQDPALLEYAGEEVFKVRIFPIDPQTRKKITLRYSQMLRKDSGLVGYTLPLKTEKFTAKPLRNLSVKLNLEGRTELKAIYSPTHKVEVKRDGTRKATVGFEANNVSASGDFQLFYTQDDSDLGISLLTYKPAGEDGYFLLLASPGVDGRMAKVIPKDVVFVLDTSGSMAGAKLEQAKKALAFCIENLNDGDRFEILRFATQVEPLFNSLREASAGSRTEAQRFVQALKPIGGTAIDDALRKAVALRPETAARPYVVIFLTDGRPTVGNVNESQILENATKAQTALTRIFCFGIGTDVNTHLLDKIAERTKAFTTYVLPEEDIEVKVSSFFTKIKEPVLAGPALKFPASLRVTRMHPSPLPDLFKGEQLIVAGRYSGSGEGAIEIAGHVSGDVKRFAYDASFPAEAGGHHFIPRLWATRRVGYLLDEIRLHGESRELKEEVTELARKYSVVTPYTAYLIQEDEAHRNVPLSRQSLPRSRDTDRYAFGAERYDAVKSKKDGDGAVADSRSFSLLKTAEAPSAAIVAGNVEALRQAPFATSGLVGRDTVSANQSMARAEAEGARHQGRFAAGKTFYRNGDKWIDAETHKRADVTRKRVTFGSSEYFSLLAKSPPVKSWVAVSRNVEFVLGDTLYEVVD